ncbi:MAG TPA: NAD(P)-dependent oxidoreductase [Capillimicrobium sp.]|jgi:3-hydroxyisobutyrate dehydrogenase-like beta-hydroxyacid dehydrogenase
MQNDDRDTRPTVGFVGLGEMGLPMAGHLAGAAAVAGFDAAPARREPAAALGVSWAASGAEAAARSTGPVVVMVRTPPQVEAAVFGPGGCLDGARGAARDIVLMSTIDPDSMAEIARRAAERNATVVDAPVSGGQRGAEAATLSIMASGDAAAIARVRPLLDRLGTVAVVGDRPGQGQAVKLANQVMMAAAMAGTVEGLEIAARHGVGEDRAREVIGRGTGASWVLEQWPWMRSLWDDYEPGNALDVLYKDMRALLDVSAAGWAPLPVTAAAFQRLLGHWTAQPAVARARGQAPDPGRAPGSASRADGSL